MRPRGCGLVILFNILFHERKETPFIQVDFAGLLNGRPGRGIDLGMVQSELYLLDRIIGLMQVNLEHGSGWKILVGVWGAIINWHSFGQPTIWELLGNQIV